MSRSSNVCYLVVFELVVVFVAAVRQLNLAVRQWNLAVRLRLSRWSVVAERPSMAKLKVADLPETHLLKVVLVSENHQELQEQ